MGNIRTSAAGGRTSSNDPALSDRSAANNAAARKEKRLQAQANKVARLKAVRATFPDAFDANDDIRVDEWGNVEGMENMKRAMPEDRSVTVPTGKKRGLHRTTTSTFKDGTPLALKRLDNLVDKNAKATVLAQMGAIAGNQNAYNYWNSQIPGPKTPPASGGSNSVSAAKNSRLSYKEPTVEALSRTYKTVDEEYYPAKDDPVKYSTSDIIRNSAFIDALLDPGQKNSLTGIINYAVQSDKQLDEIGNSVIDVSDTTIDIDKTDVGGANYTAAKGLQSSNSTVIQGPKGPGKKQKQNPVQKGEFVFWKPGDSDPTSLLDYLKDDTGANGMESVIARTAPSAVSDATFSYNTVVENGITKIVAHANGKEAVDFYADQFNENGGSIFGTNGTPSGALEGNRQYKKATYNTATGEWEIRLTNGDLIATISPVKIKVNGVDEYTQSVNLQPGANLWDGKNLKAASDKASLTKQYKLLSESIYKH